ncbi:hypothetical protein [Lapidilactobacillus wuchangensis]|uniref:hypothetical protein n=1 Tax=Lapidilactobacillus wuchangensis TaxID=2486001 RepID=UPI0013DDC003|nr:hypothetical protein [Lapidilactobacillus wuchangensis]
MEGVVVSRQIILSNLSLRIRLVSKTIWFVIGVDQCRQRSTTETPGMASDSILFQNSINVLKQPRDFTLSVNIDLFSSGMLR